MAYVSLLEAVELHRPEYARQPEAILTDLLWRSCGSSLSKTKLKKRIVLKLTEYRKEVIETLPFALKADPAIFQNPEAFEGNAYSALLGSLTAPRARGEKSVACVPIHPDMAVLQNLMGLVNKNQPANLADIVETIGWYGGAPVQGAVARTYLETALSDHGGTGLVALLNAASPRIAVAAWDGYAPTEDYVSIAPVVLTGDTPSPFQSYPTPCKWFWKHWQTLCSPVWYEQLPIRRWTDWALCLLRSALGFTYLWQASFFSTVIEGVHLSATGNIDAATQYLNSFLQNGDYTLARLLDPRLPATQRNVSPALRGILTSGEQARTLLDDSGLQILQSDDLMANLLDLFRRAGEGRIPVPSAAGVTYSKNTYEFVRYAMLPRSTEGGDQSDFYFIAKSDSRSFWFEPGPEWIVVIASLCSKKPGASCTVREIMDELRLLGMRVQRTILVEILERAGLTIDSPDADDALVVQAGF